MTPARDPKQRENHEKSRFWLFRQWIFGQNPFQNLRKTRPIILNRSQPPPTLPDPFYIDFIFFNFFRKSNARFFFFFYVFPIFSSFFQLWRLQDQSQIVDLIFPLKPVSSRASETPKVPHSWQNNVQNVSQTNMQNSDIKKMVIVPLEFTGRRKGVA